MNSWLRSTSTVVHSEVQLITLLNDLEGNPMLSQPVHRAKFLILFEAQINQSLLEYKAGGKSEDEVI